VLGFGIVDGVPADHRAARLRGNVAAALEYCGEEFGGQLLPGPAHQVERHHGGAAHGVDVREGVRSGDAAPVVGVVDHRGEEVRGGQDRQILADLDGGGVVAVVQADEDFRAGYGRAGQTADCFLELTGGNLARTPATMGEARQPNRLHPSTLTAPLRPRERGGAFRSPDLLPYPERWILRLSRRPCGGCRGGCQASPGPPSPERCTLRLPARPTLSYTAEFPESAQNLAFGAEGVAEHSVRGRRGRATQRSGQKGSRNLALHTPP